jgi:basic amino acid/polyamine antiporter, APA family
MSETISKAPPTSAVVPDTEFVRGLGLFDSVMVVVGVMIGSGIFIVSADMSRTIGSPGWLLVAWVITGVLTIAASLSYGELASMMPRAGGMYVYLREAFSPILGFLYGWTLFTVIQTGTIAAVAVAFALFSGVLWPGISQTSYWIAPIHISSRYAISLSSAQFVAILVIVLLTWANSRGLEYGKRVQNTFTLAKTAALLGLIVVGLWLGRNTAAMRANFGHFWSFSGFVPLKAGLSATTAFGLLVAICVSQSGSLFAADSWHDITFAAGEVRNPRRTLPLALAIGSTLVIGLYLLANVGYLATLPLSAIQHAASDRVATAVLQAVYPGAGKMLMAIAIMISTFGCVNSLVLAGPRAYYAMARDGLFFQQAARLNRAKVPATSLWIQGTWAALLVLPRTYNPVTRQYGSLYSNLLDYVISAALIFYILTIGGLFRLRRTHPHAERPYKAVGYPLVPALYILGAATITVTLFAYRPSTTWPGLLIVCCGLPVYGYLAVGQRRRSDKSVPVRSQETGEHRAKPRDGGA